MKIEQAHIARIRTAFEKMRSKEDLLHIMNEAKILVYGDKAVPFQLKQLTWYANPKLGRTRYVEFKIKKKSGTDRSINAPVAGLKAIQRTLAFILQCVFEPHKSAMGFVKKRSIVDNAKIHAGAKYVYNIDLKDFFSSIDQARVWKCFQLPPFNLETSYESEPAKTIKYVSGKQVYYTQKDNFRIDYEVITPNKIIIFKTGDYDKFKEKISNDPFFEEKINSNIDWEKNSLPALIELVLQSAIKKNVVNAKDADPNDASIAPIKANGTQSIANMLASICCTALDVERKNSDGDWITIRKSVLPQGAPTSPVITNIICQKLDHRLSGVAKRFGLKYSRYADDITFSSMHNVYQPVSDFLKELHRIIAEQNFHIKESKTRLQKDGYRKEVTGLLVNEKANVQQRYIKQLRMWLYYWERYGNERASGLFLQQYIADRGHVKNGKPNMTNIISGKLDYLKMVKGADNELYLKLKARFDALNSGDVAKDNIIKKVDKITSFSSLEALSSIPNLVTDPDLMNELLDEHYGSQVNLLAEPWALYSGSEKNTGKIRIKINIVGNSIGQAKLKKSIHIPEGEIIPIDRFEENEVVIPEDNKPKYLNPFHLYNFLFEYNQNPILRTTCHDIDANELKSLLEACKTESYIFNEHLKLIVSAYEEHEKAYSAPFQIKALIRGYLTGNDYNGKITGWSSRNIKINWSTIDLSIWANENSNTPPNASNIILREKKVKSYKIEPQIKSPITEKVIQTFTQLVLHFKNLFHLKSGPQSLKEIIQRVNSEKGWYNNVDFEIDNPEFSNNLEHFVDVEKLMQAYNKIIELIIEQHKANEKPKVKLKYYEENHKVFFSIHHLNGVYNKTIENTIERFGQTYTSLIKNQINGLCNLRMKADFGNEKYAEINLWDGADRKSIKISHFEGVEHSLEFPKIFKT